VRHHPIAPEIPCPFCGRPGLVFAGALRMGDKYTCSCCLYTSMHLSNGRRRKGCCLRAVLSGIRLGPPQPCGGKPQ
jgi:transposase-like protein